MLPPHQLLLRKVNSTSWVEFLPQVPHGTLRRCYYCRCSSPSAPFYNSAPSPTAERNGIAITNHPRQLLLIRRSEMSRIRPMVDTNIIRRQQTILLMPTTSIAMPQMNRASTCRYHRMLMPQDLIPEAPQCPPITVRFGYRMRDSSLKSRPSLLSTPVPTIISSASKLSSGLTQKSIPTVDT